MSTVTFAEAFTVVSAFKVAVITLRQHGLSIRIKTEGREDLFIGGRKASIICLHHHDEKKACILDEAGQEHSFSGLDITAKLEFIKRAVENQNIEK